LSPVLDLLSERADNDAADLTEDLNRGQESRRNIQGNSTNVFEIPAKNAGGRRNSISKRNS
jgi:hypothetical protein